MIAKDWDRAHLWRFRAQWLPGEYMDGDTFTVLSDTGYDGRHEAEIRLHGYSADETWDPGGFAATERLRAALTQAAPTRWNLRIVSLQRVRVVTETKSFTRYVSDVWVAMADGMLRDVKELLIS